MKKKIANGLELILLIVSFILLWIPTLKVQYVVLLRELPLETYALALVEKGAAYGIIILYGINALMCLISIIVKPEHRDGKMHIIMPILLFLYNVSFLRVEIGTVAGKWEIVESNFPVPLFLGCMAGVFVISIVKRSTIIAGIPKVEEIRQKSSTTDESKVVEIRQKSSTADELKKYKELLDSGAITQEEYDVKKKQLLN